ncbi:MAG: NAD-dependent epimerase/dehydratase family protein [Halobacteriovoraceae bacterium]|nr:NAD-dependent epimerase/dehydratase family protein [Halobacteriovoraceae bacterium]
MTLSQNKKNLLIIGSNGFIGRNCVEYFSSSKFNGEFNITATYFRNKPPEVEGVNYVKVDMTNKQEVHKVLIGQSLVIQAAATTSGAGEITSSPFFHVTDNAVMNAFLFREAAEQGVEQVIFLSCTIMYESMEKPQKETDFNANKEMHEKYFGPGWTKVYNEKMAEFYSRFSNTKFTVLRHSNVYGPHDKFNPKKSHVFAASLLKVLDETSNNVVIWGKGEEKRDLIYVDDMTRCLEACFKQENPFELFNVGLSRILSITDLVKTMLKTLNIDKDLIFDDTKPSFKNSYALDCSKIKSTLGWEATTSIEEGIRKTAVWLKENPDQIKK